MQMWWSNRWISNIIMTQIVFAGFRRCRFHFHVLRLAFILIIEQYNHFVWNSFCKKYLLLTIVFLFWIDSVQSHSCIITLWLQLFSIWTKKKHQNNNIHTQWKRENQQMIVSKVLRVLTTDCITSLLYEK